MPSQPISQPAPPRPSPSLEWLALVEQKVTGLHFGSVHITVHEGRVTQIDVMEKTRLPQKPAPGNSCIS